MFRQSERIDYLELLNSLLRINPNGFQYFLCSFDVMFIYVHYVATKCFSISF